MMESPASAGLFFYGCATATRSRGVTVFARPVDKMTRNLNAIGSLDLDVLEKAE
jgi:hypothetical protein